MHIYIYIHTCVTSNVPVEACPCRWPVAFAILCAPLNLHAHNCQHLSKKKSNTNNLIMTSCEI